MFDTRLHCRGEFLHFPRAVARVGEDEVDVVVVVGVVDGDVFHTWATEILLPELPACSVIVMDNAPFHKRQDTLDALKAEGHTVLWLPSYSPDFNPIEKM